MMVLKVISFFVVLVQAHELAAPCDYDEKSELRLDELGDLQLLRMFQDSVGLLSGLPDEAITASDAYDENHDAIYSRIGFEKVSGKSHGWCGKKGEQNQIMVDLTKSSVVTGVATQGRGDEAHQQWVTKYSIETSENGEDWIDRGIFGGNFDVETICMARFEHPVLARYVKLYVVEYNNNPCMRWDVLGFKKL